MVDIFGIGLHLLNVILAALLLYAYFQNYRKIRTKYTIGLMAFAAVFLLQSLAGVALESSMQMYFSAEAELAGMVLEALKAAALAVLLWTSWD